MIMLTCLSLTIDKATCKWSPQMIDSRKNNSSPNLPNLHSSSLLRVASWSIPDGRSWRSWAVTSSPAPLSAVLRASRVANVMLPRLSPGVHWSHSDSIALSQLVGASEYSDGLLWIWNSSSGLKPNNNPIFSHLAPQCESCLRRLAWWVVLSLVGWLYGERRNCCGMVKGPAVTQIAKK